MSKTLIERLVEKRDKLRLDWDVPIEDEAIWWVNVIADELYDARGFWNGESYDWLRLNGVPENKK